MSLAEIAALVFVGVTMIVVAFQAALALGAPWGEYSMGGAFPGRYLTHMRAVAAAMAVVLALMAVVVLARAGLTLPAWDAAARWLVWGVVMFMAVGTVLNAITPRAKERVWAPVTALLLACSVVVAVSGGG